MSAIKGIIDVDIGCIKYNYKKGSFDSSKTKELESQFRIADLLIHGAQ